MPQLGWRAFRVRMRDKNSSGTNTLVLAGMSYFILRFKLWRKIGFGDD
jgi:hypothetical protein